MPRRRAASRPDALIDRPMARRGRRQPRLSVEERIRLDNERRWQRELEMMHRQGFDLHFCSVCSREGPWQAWADGWCARTATPRFLSESNRYLVVATVAACAHALLPVCIRGDDPYSPWASPNPISVSGDALRAVCRKGLVVGCRFLRALATIAPLVILLMWPVAARADLLLVFTRGQAAVGQRVEVVSGDERGPQPLPSVHGIRLYLVPMTHAKSPLHQTSTGPPRDPSWVPVGRLRHPHAGVFKFSFVIPNVAPGRYTIGFWCIPCAPPKGATFTTAYPGRVATGRPLHQGTSRDGLAPDGSWQPGGRVAARRVVEECHRSDRRGGGDCGLLIRARRRSLVHAALLRSLVRRARSWLQVYADPLPGRAADWSP